MKTILITCLMLFITTIQTAQTCSTDTVSINNTAGTLYATIENGSLLLFWTELDGTLAHLLRKDGVLLAAGVTDTFYIDSDVLAGGQGRFCNNVHVQNPPKALVS